MRPPTMRLQRRLLAGFRVKRLPVVPLLRLEGAAVARWSNRRLVPWGGDGITAEQARGRMHAAIVHGLVESKAATPHMRWRVAWAHGTDRVRRCGVPHCYAHVPRCYIIGSIIFNPDAHVPTATVARGLPCP